MREIEKEIRTFSDRAFKDHVITERMRQGVFRSWRCQRPRTWSYGFDITTTPGNLIITGDLGDLIVSRVFDMLPWCRGSVDSTDYFAEKVPRSIETSEFSEDRLKAWVQRELDEADEYELSEEKREILRNALLMDDFGSYDRSHWYEEFRDIWGDEPPNWTDYKPGFLWCRDAIRWFVTHHQEAEIGEAAIVALAANPG
jgi:hypothetical protein